MNGDVVAEHPMKRRQLRAVVYKIALAYLEVERGLRAPDQLAEFLSPAEYVRHRATRRGPTGVVQPVHPPDIGRVRIDAATRDRVNASVLVRRGDEHWSALLIDLRQTGRGWQVEKLDRLERLAHLPSRRLEVADKDDVARRARHIEDERWLVALAREAVAQRIDEIGDGRTRAARELRPGLDRWARRVEELDRELVTLNLTHQLREHHGLSAKPEQPTLRKDHETGGGAFLGPRPDEPGRARIWDGASQALHAYRHRWGLSDEEPVLHPSGNENQAVDRQELLEHLRNAAQALGRCQDVPREVANETGPSSLAAEL